MAEVELGAPKVICQTDQFNHAVSIYSDNRGIEGAVSNAYATGPQGKMPVYVNWKAKSRVYNYPVVAFSGINLDEETLKAKFWHETMHNLGYSHIDEGPDRAFFCEAACFGRTYGFDGIQINGAKSQCEAPKNSTSTFSQLEDIKRVIIGATLRAD